MLKPETAPPIHPQTHCLKCGRLSTTVLCKFCIGEHQTAEGYAIWPDHDPSTLRCFAMIAEREGDEDAARVFRSAADEIDRLRNSERQLRNAIRNLIDGDV